MYYRESKLLPHIERLAPSALEMYPELPTLLPPFESALATIVRARSMKSQIEEKPNETVLGHLAGEYGILTVAEDCFATCPNLARELRLRSFVGQVFLHDWPEIVVKDHDHATTSPHKHHLNGNKERAEKLAFGMFLLPLIENPQLAEEVNVAFSEFMDNQTLESIFTHLIDRLAGNWAVLSQHLNRNIEQSGQPMGMDENRVDVHVIRHAIEVSELAQKFAESGISEIAQKEWWKWFSTTFSHIYESTGHGFLPDILALNEKHNGKVREE